MSQKTAQRIAENLAKIRQRTAKAAEAAGRSADAVRIVAVSKYVGAAECQALLAAGATMLGESRPQQLWTKAADKRLADASWHLVGHLQRNKAARTLPLVDLIHSVDSLRLLTAINAAAEDRQSPARVLLEVNCSGDAAKHGFSPDEVKRTVEQLGGDQPGDWPHVEVCGLMTMAAREGGETVAGANFAALRRLRDELQARRPGLALSELSMGMSGDFEIAIAEGATLVRIGSALFEGIA